MGNDTGSRGCPMLSSYSKRVGLAQKRILASIRRRQRGFIRYLIPEIELFAVITSHQFLIVEVSKIRPFRQHATGFPAIIIDEDLIRLIGRCRQLSDYFTGGEVDDVDPAICLVTA